MDKVNLFYNDERKKQIAAVKDTVTDLQQVMRFLLETSYFPSKTTKTKK